MSGFLNHIFHEERTSFLWLEVPDSTLDRVLNPVEDPDPKMYVIRMKGEPYCYPSCGSGS